MYGINNPGFASRILLGGKYIVKEKRDRCSNVHCDINLVHPCDYKMHRLLNPKVFSPDFDTFLRLTIASAWHLRFVPILSPQQKFYPALQPSSNWEKRHLRASP